MKKSNLLKNTVIFNSLLSLAIIWAFIFYIAPEIMDISDKKTSLINMSSDIERIKSKWMTFEEYSKVVSSWHKEIFERQEFSDSIRQKYEPIFSDSYLAFVLSNNPKQLYAKNLSNSSLDNYEVFLSKKEEELKNKSDSNLIAWRSQKVSNILPNYVESWEEISDENSNNYDDFKYINYIERLLYTYDIKNNSSVSIGQVFPVEVAKKWQQIVEWWINYFDVSLDLVWKKKNIVDFILFLENVWTIEIDWDNIKVVRNPLFQWKVLSWDVANRVYNILENPIVEVKEISFEDYIDSSLSTSSWNLSLYDLISRTQSREQLETRVVLRLYAKWEPNSKKREFSKDVLNSYGILLQKTNSLINRLNSQREKEITDKNILIDISRAENIRDYLLALDMEIKQTRPLLARPDMIDSLYSKAKNIDKSFSQIEKFLSSFENKN